MVPPLEAGGAQGTGGALPLESGARGTSGEEAGTPLRQFQEETVDLEVRLWVTDEVCSATEARLQERERDSERKGLRYNLATIDGKRRHGDGRGDRRRAPGGAQDPRTAANDLDY